MRPARAALTPRDLATAARTGAAFALVGATLLVVLTLTVPSFAPTTLSRWGSLTMAAALCVQGAMVVRVPQRLPALFWVTIPTQVLGAMTFLAITTSDASASAQLFVIWPVLFAAYELRPGAAAWVLLQAVVAEAVVVFSVLPLDRAVNDLVCVGATLSVLCWVLVRAREDQARLVAQLERRAAVDPLTGLATRRVLDESLRAALDTPRPMSTVLALVDLDHFKTINDELGHPTGDAVLVHVANVLTRVFPSPALVARLGGDELAVLLLDADVASVANRADQLCRLLRTAPPVSAEPAIPPVTVSVGVAAADGPVPRDLYSRADQALYAAKRAGRNGVRTLVDPPRALDVEPATETTRSTR